MGKYGGWSGVLVCCCSEIRRIEMEDESLEFLHRSNVFILMEADHQCSSCGSQMSVAGILLPAGYEEMSIEDDPADDSWGVFGMPCIVSKISNISPEALQFIKGKYPLFDKAKSVFGGDVYLNRCGHCQAFQQDEDLHHVGHAFMPIAEEKIEAIRLTTVESSILLNGSSSWGTISDMLADRQRREAEIVSES